jgi:hypothetical protein
VFKIARILLRIIAKIWSSFCKFGIFLSNGPDGKISPDLVSLLVDRIVLGKKESFWILVLAGKEVQGVNFELVCIRALSQTLGRSHRNLKPGSLIV